MTEISFTIVTSTLCQYMLNQHNDNVSLHLSSSELFISSNKRILLSNEIYFILTEDLEYTVGIFLRFMGFRTFYSFVDHQ